eukprot:755811-Hanusia_phi.AAC.2
MQGCVQHGNLKVVLHVRSSSLCAVVAIWPSRAIVRSPMLPSRLILRPVRPGCEHDSSSKKVRQEPVTDNQQNIENGPLLCSICDDHIEQVITRCGSKPKGNKWGGIKLTFVSENTREQEEI